MSRGSPSDHDGVGGRGFCPDSPPWTPDFRTWTPGSGTPSSPPTPHPPGTPPSTPTRAQEDVEAWLSHAEAAAAEAYERTAAEEHEQAWVRFVTTILQDILDLQLAKVEDMLSELEARRDPRP